MPIMLKRLLNSLPILLTLIVLGVNPALAQVNGDTEVLKVHSKSFVGSADFIVTLPSKYHENKDQKYLVLVDFHPRSHAYLAGLHDWMSHNGAWPWLETIIITAPDGHEGLGKLKSFDNAQQGQALLDFIGQDLLAAVDAKYRTNGFRILSGFTGNASISLFTLLHRPELFNAYIAASPILSDNHLSLMTDAINALPDLARKSTTQPRMLFLSRADSGYEQQQIADFDKFTELLKLKAPKNLIWRSQLFEGSYYMSQPALATIYAIEMFFDDIHKSVEPESALGKQGPQAIYEHYQWLSQRYGFEVSAVDSLLNLAKSKTDLKQALAVGTFCVAKYPQDAHAHHGLAVTLAALGQSSDAIAELTLAMSLTKHPFYLNRWGKLLTEYQTE
ncbi:alpha/beta hydrolase-fold protein [Shewanella sp.]|uniref:alpha/beta hydrolase-fold protein n=1 Tax=Shewanella sp. TaxID=50422 RepID=UPI00405387D4